MSTDWFGHWLSRHLQRHENAGLPDPARKPLFYETWRDEFAKSGVTLDAAEAASRLLATQKYVKHAHFAALLKAIKETRWADRASDIDQIKADSKACRECYGEGLASVRCRNTGMSFAAYCVCPYGTYRLRRARREAKPTTQLIDLAAIRNGETYRVAVAGKVLTLDFDLGDDGFDYVAAMPQDWRERLEKQLNPEQTGVY